MIYIMCISKYATGGTELLHQLFQVLSKKSKSIKMFYIGDIENPINERFLKYNIEYVNKIEDDERNVLIIPEIFTGEAKKYQKIKKIIWWLSVDFYFKTSLGIEKDKINLRYIVKQIIQGNYFNRFINFRDENIIHLYQSEYARMFLEERHVKYKLKLSDYLGDDFLDINESTLNLESREDIILYNPKKGIETTTKIIEELSDFRFVPLENMTPEQIKVLLSKSKIYVDFGFHPGKDRIPREAALMGCVVLTNREGAALNKVDIPVNSNFKFENPIRDIRILRSLIQSIFTDFEIYQSDLFSYRERIRNEKVEFLVEVESLWNVVLSKYV